MRREDLLSEVEVAFREAFPDRVHRLLREVERWCREAPDPASRNWRWFDGGDDAGKGKFDRERVAAFRCSFCTRSLLDATSLIGMCVDPERGGPRFTLEGYRHPVDQRPSGEQRPEMMCNFCRDTYHERFADLEFFGSGLPDADMLIADAARALRSRRPERAEEAIRRDGTPPRALGASAPRNRNVLALRSGAGAGRSRRLDQRVLSLHREGALRRQ